MLISVECELPAVMAKTAAPVPPQVFIHVWQTLSEYGWDADDFGVSRKVEYPPADCIRAEQVITTDTGPTIELAPCPRQTVQEIEIQITSLRRVIAEQLDPHGVKLFGGGVHPALGATREEYYAFRTQRKAYDYAIEQRGWSHHSILNICATQEIIDVTVSDAIRVLRVMHRLAGLSLFLFRNDPDLHDAYPRAPYSIRPSAWRTHIPQGGYFAKDALKVWLPPTEIVSWEQYLALLWDTNPMFLLGTKNSGLVYVPTHPTFWEYLTNTPKGGWLARTLAGNAETHLYPEFAHVLQTDWTYMGFARLRWKWKSPLPDIGDLIDARVNGMLDDFLTAHLEKIVLEHRANTAPMQGQEMTSLAFVTGLVSNLEDAERFTSRYPYEFWLRIACAAESQPLRGSIDKTSLTALLQEILEVSHVGLKARGFSEEEYLSPLYERVEKRTSSSEVMLEIFRNGGTQALLRSLCYDIG